MKVGIMQPYFFPYIGYWQLLNAVDKYVVYDDVNYIKNGWINRNRILINGQPHWFTLPLNKASPFNLINEINISSENKVKENMLKTLHMAYHKAPFFNEVFPLVEKTIFYSLNLSESLFFSIQEITKYLGIRTELILSSTLSKDNTLKGKNKVLSICKLLNADVYLNAIGGQDLYDKQEFQEHDLKLEFLQTDKVIIYKQLKNQFVPNLSIIDVLMFNSAEQIKQMLDNYTLL